MTTIQASIGTENYTTTLVSQTGLSILADEPVAHGGQNKGFSPHELLAASLASCTTITLRMYADRKGWRTEGLQVMVSLERDLKLSITALHCQIALPTDMPAEQQARLLEIAQHCPIHKVLILSLPIHTTLI